MIWSHKISDYDSSSGALSRTSPAIHGNDVIVGDIEVEFVLHNGTNIIAVDRVTGALRWITRVDTHPTSQITGSPVVFGDVIYVGVTSLEEDFAVFPFFGVAYPCCTFRGSVVALDANSGKLLWKTYTMPDNGGQPAGYSGGAVWQRRPPAKSCGASPAGARWWTVHPLWTAYCIGGRGTPRPPSPGTGNNKLYAFSLQPRSD